MSGTLFLDFNAGQVPSSQLSFNLARPQTPASYFDLKSGKIFPDYFGKYNITLKYGEQFSVGITAEANLGTCNVLFVMTVLVGNRTVREIMSDHEKPFNVTKINGGRQVPGSYSAYSDLYVSGLPRQSGFWVRVNPGVFNPFCNVSCMRDSIIH